MVSLLEFTVAVAPLCLSIHQHVDQCVIIYPMHPIQRQLTLLHQQRLRLREKVGTHPLRLGRPLALAIIWHQLSLDAVHGTEPQLQGTRTSATGYEKIRRLPTDLPSLLQLHRVKSYEKSLVGIERMARRRQRRLPQMVSIAYPTCYMSHSMTT